MNVVDLDDVLHIDQLIFAHSFQVSGRPSKQGSKLLFRKLHF